ncbi:acyl-CoA thioester hydrolase [Listeria monocytogenes]|nr:acyl-CoA thioester hydrolase [Listeria monocytogenes]GAT38270.1 acyl-CoA thioester hydrolase [Listeria monocytogenes]GAT40285.1 acyl-CoA thioester hydrolase [Listeria monocytogenes]
MLLASAPAWILFCSSVSGLTSGTSTVLPSASNATNVKKDVAAK